MGTEIVHAQVVICYQAGMLLALGRKMRNGWRALRECRTQHGYGGAPDMVQKDRIENAAPVTEVETETNPDLQCKSLTT